MLLSIPAVLKIEHDELYQNVRLITNEPGETGQIAGELASFINDHFGKEENLALPPLSVLLPLTNQAITEDMRGIIAVTDEFKKEYPGMLEEHKKIMGAAKRMVVAARQEKNYEAAHFVEKLIMHAQIEEQILYPAALLVGEHLKLFFKCGLPSSLAFRDSLSGINPNLQSFQPPDTRPQ
jgi:hypothetical protein